MPTEPTTYREKADAMTPGRLSGLADVAMPDRPASPGADFLGLVASPVGEAIDYRPALLTDADAWDEEAHEVADGCVPVYTHRLWETFVDLAAYQESDDEGLIADALGARDATLEKVAQIALYQIAERLAHALRAEWADALENDDEDA